MLSAVGHKFSSTSRLMSCLLIHLGNNILASLMHPWQSAEMSRHPAFSVSKRSDHVARGDSTSMRKIFPLHCKNEKAVKTQNFKATYCTRVLRLTQIPKFFKKTTNFHKQSRFNFHVYFQQTLKKHMTVSFKMESCNSSVNF